ncbi:hypothetical protein D3C78_798450 [compost metagenome]
MRCRHLFLWCKLIFNDFKHAVKTGQREHQHHHAADTRRFNKLLIGAGDVVQIFAIAFGFSVLLATNCHVEFGGGFDR